MRERLIRWLIKRWMPGYHLQRNKRKRDPGMTHTTGPTDTIHLYSDDHGNVTVTQGEEAQWRQDFGWSGTRGTGGR